MNRGLFIRRYHLPRRVMRRNAGSRFGKPPFFLGDLFAQKRKLLFGRCKRLLGSFVSGFHPVVKFQVVRFERTVLTSINVIKVFIISAAKRPLVNSANLKFYYGIPSHLL